MGTRHAGIFGRTQMGKSFLAHILCDEFTKAGRETLVYDITLDDAAVAACNAHRPDAEWNASYTTNDQEVFLALFWARHDLICFIDEGTETVGRFNDEMKWPATRGSHQRGELGAGSSLFYIAHGYKSLNNTLRDQMSEYFVFATSKTTARDLADEFDHAELMGAPHLDIGEFYHVGSGIKPAKWRIDFDRRKIVKAEKSDKKGENDE